MRAWYARHCGRGRQRGKGGKGGKPAVARSVAVQVYDKDSLTVTSTSTRTETGQGFRHGCELGTDLCCHKRANKGGGSRNKSRKLANCVYGCKTISKTDIAVVGNKYLMKSATTTTRERSITKCNCCIINLYDAQLLSSR